MSGDWKTIRIPEDDWHRHNEKRKELDLTWAEYLDGKVEDHRDMSPETVEALDELRQELTKRGGIDDVELLSEKLDRNYEATKEATNAAQNAENAISEATQR